VLAALATMTLSVILLALDDDCWVDLNVLLFIALFLVMSTSQKCLEPN